MVKMSRVVDLRLAQRGANYEKGSALRILYAAHSRVGGPILEDNGR